MAASSQADVSLDADERSLLFSCRFAAFLHELRDNPSAQGVLTVRCLFDAQQDFLKEFGFADAFCKQKKASLTSITFLKRTQLFVICINAFHEDFCVRTNPLMNLCITNAIVLLALHGLLILSQNAFVTRS
ncbi:unnamed protein product [Protopolystoma xenopodis]|uniref:Uncharacterized protein n=1 Tax=Protopolystoma xenopodis TaxID=117903 RepID=A0A3S5CJE1_9PLAT|nr:unnamed protein product [Protopolystoma xenopodis]